MWPASFTVTKRLPHDAAKNSARGRSTRGSFGLATTMLRQEKPIRGIGLNPRTSGGVCAAESTSDGHTSNAALAPCPNISTQCATKIGGDAHEAMCRCSVSSYSARLGRSQSRCTTRQHDASAASHALWQWLGPEPESRDNEDRSGGHAGLGLSCTGFMMLPRKILRQSTAPFPTTCLGTRDTLHCRRN